MDALSFLEIAYDLDVDSREALSRLALAAAIVLDREAPILAYEIEPTRGLVNLSTFATQRADDGCVRAQYELSLSQVPAVRRTLLYQEPAHVIATELMAGTDTIKRAAEMGLYEQFGILAPTGDGTGVIVAAQPPGPVTQPPRERAYWTEIAQHLAGAWRLRGRLHAAQRASRVAAVLRPDGSHMQLNDEAIVPSLRTTLRAAVVEREKIRSRRRSAATERLWPALVAGRWSLVDSFSACGRRHVIAYENPPCAPSLRALRPEEHMVLDLLLSGRSAKWIAADLELSLPTVTRILQNALRRLGARRLESLGGLRAALFERLDAVPGIAAITIETTVRLHALLTPAENEAVSGVLEGFSTAAIAAKLRKSPRTVAHQLTAAYRKLGVSSRRELVARLE